MSSERRTEILGSKINAVKKADVIADLERAVTADAPCYVCASNVHTVVEGYRNRELQAITNQSFRSIPDGAPIWWVQRLRGVREAEHFPGPELFEALLARGEQTGHTHFFYGGTPDAVGALIEKVAKEFPKTRVVGHHCPPFRELTSAERQDIIAHVNSLRPDFIWVGLGAPKQELWMAEHVSQINHGVLVGVGAAFNFFGGTVRRAPVWMRNAGLEWLYRMIQERRLISRYVRTNVIFLLHLPLELLRNRRFP